jgi:DNA-binding MarR family transcriptional regulator
MEIEKIIKSTIELNITKKVMLNLTYTKNHVADKFTDILKPFDISSEQYNVLRILRGQKGKPVNMQNIQDRMVTKNSNTTRLIDKLLIKEMVTRMTCPDNRRKIEIYITEKGLTVLKQIDPILEEYEKHCTQNFTTQELEQLNKLLEKLRTN